MMVNSTQLVSIGGGKVRLSNDELHRRASKAIYESNHIVFDSLPNLIAQIIENKVWEGYNHTNFADYALDAGSNGLGINSDPRLWLLRCAMDVQHKDHDGRTVPGRHIEEWADVLAKVEDMVKLIPVSERGSTKYLNGNSLETIAKNCPTLDKITYLPSRQKSTDGDLLRLRKNHPETFSLVMGGKMTARQGMVAARKADGVRTGNESNLSRAQSAFRKMTDEERSEFLQWLTDEGHLCQTKKN